MNAAPACRVDAHIHLFETGYHLSDRPGAELVRYEGIRTAAGIDLALVVGYEGQPRFRGNNDYVLRESGVHPWIVPLAYLPVVPPPPPEAIRRLSDSGFAGFSVYLPDAGPSLSDWPRDALTALDDGGLISVNCTLAGLDRAAPTLARTDKSHVLVSHLGGPPHILMGASRATVATAIEPVVRLGRCQHVRIKLSGLYAIDPTFPHLGAAEIVQAYLEALGPGRFVWGSDFAPALDSVTEDQVALIPEWLRQQLTASEIAGLLGGNLERLLAMTRADPLLQRRLQAGRSHIQSQLPS